MVVVIWNNCVIFAVVIINLNGFGIMDKKVIILSRVSTLGQDLVQQTEAVRKLCLMDGFSDGDIVTIEDKESAVLLSEEERNRKNLIVIWMYIR